MQIPHSQTGPHTECGRVWDGGKTLKPFLLDWNYVWEMILTKATEIHGGFVAVKMKCVKSVESVWQAVAVDTLSLCGMCVYTCEFEIKDEAAKSTHQESRSAAGLFGPDRVALSTRFYMSASRLMSHVWWAEPENMHTLCSDLIKDSKVKSKLKFLSCY